MKNLFLGLGILTLILFLYNLTPDLFIDSKGIERVGYCIFYGVQAFMYIYIYILLNKDEKKQEEMIVPEEGRRIRLTWLKHCRNVSSDVPNPYIGMIGYVRNLKTDGSFDLQCENCWLIVINEYKFEYLD